MRQIKRIHFIGIGGAGMGGIAEVLCNKGYTVTGSDKAQNAMTKHLSELGIEIIYDHKSENLQDADVVVITSALTNDNPELLAAKAKGIPVVRRAEMLAELMRFGNSIAVAGTHGKTTTTSILASIMATAKLDPTFVIGGKLNSIGTNARLGQGNYFIAEADESDASFLHLNPVISIVTNIDRDHMATYGGDFKNLRQVFVDFLYRLPFYGLAVLNIDDPVTRDIIPEVRRQVVTYGQSPNANYQLINYRQKESKSRFTVLQKKNNLSIDFELNLPGTHNALNAVATIAVCLEEGVAVEYIQKALKEFKGIDRRFQVYNNVKLATGATITLVDDYGHHPEELKATIETIGAGWPDKRVVMLYQPHRYTRTRDLFNDFVDVLATVDQLVLVPIYAASELPIAGISSTNLYNAIIKHPEFVSRQNGCHNFDSIDDMLNQLDSIVQDDDIVVVQGAGDIGTVIHSLLDNQQQNIA